MARIVNPQNIDVDDDAVFAGALSQGLIWIEDDDIKDLQHQNIKFDEYDLGDVVYEAREFILQQPEEWINFTYVAQYLYGLFENLRDKQFKEVGKSYKNVLKLLADHPSHFGISKDTKKQGLFWIRVILESPTSSYTTGQIFWEMHSFITDRRHEAWVNFTRLSHHIFKKFPELDLNQIGMSGKKYKNLRQVVEDYPQYFTLRPDTSKSGLYYIRITEKDY